MLKTTPDQRIRKAKRIAAAAIEHGKVINENPTLPRSTRSRAAYKLRSEALERVLAVLSGKE